MSRALIDKVRSESEPNLYGTCTLYACAHWSDGITSFKSWCREGESNPQDPKVGGF